MTFRKKSDGIPKTTRIALVEYELDYIIKEKRKSKLKLEKILNESKSTPVISNNDVGNNDSQVLDFGKSTTSTKKFGRSEKERLIDVNYSEGKNITKDNVKQITKFLSHLEKNGDPRANGVGNEGGHIARVMGDPGPVNGHYKNAIPDPMALDTTSEIFGHSLPKIQLHTFRDLNHPEWDHRFIDGNCLQDNKIVIDHTPERLSMSASFRQEIAKFRPISGRPTLQGNSSSSKLLGSSGGSRAGTAPLKKDELAAAYLHGNLVTESNKSSRVTSANYSSKRSSRANSVSSQNGSHPHHPVDVTHSHIAAAVAAPGSSSVAHQPTASAATVASAAAASHFPPNIAHRNTMIAGVNSSHNDSGHSAFAGLAAASAHASASGAGASGSAPNAHATTGTEAAGHWSPMRYSPTSGGDSDFDSDEDFHFNRESVLSSSGRPSQLLNRGTHAPPVHVIPSPLDNVSDNLWTHLMKELRDSGAAIDYKQLIEINSLREPHETVINCFGFICHLFGLAPTWQAARCVLFKELAALQNFLHTVDPMDVQVRRIKKALAFREEKLSNVTIHSLSMTCKPMAGIMRWITAFYKIGEYILPDYEAKQQQLAQALEGSLVSSLQEADESQVMLVGSDGELVNSQPLQQQPSVVTAEADGVLGEGLNTESFVTQVQDSLGPRPRTTPAVLMNHSSSHSNLTATKKTKKPRNHSGGSSGRSKSPEGAGNKTMRPSKSSPSMTTSSTYSYYSSMVMTSPSVVTADEGTEDNVTATGAGVTAEGTVETPDYRQMFLDMTNKRRCKSAGNPRKHYLPQPFTLEPILQQKRQQEALLSPLSGSPKKGTKSSGTTPVKSADGPTKKAAAPSPQDAQSNYYNNLVNDDYNEEDLFEMFAEPAATAAATTPSGVSEKPDVKVDVTAEPEEGHSLQVSPITPSPSTPPPPTVVAAAGTDVEAVYDHHSSNWSKLIIPHHHSDDDDDKNRKAVVLLTPTNADTAAAVSSPTSGKKLKKDKAGKVIPPWRQNKPPSPFLQPVPKKKIIPSKFNNGGAGETPPLLKKKSTKAVIDVSIAVTLMENAVQATVDTNEEYGYDGFEDENNAALDRENNAEDAEVTAAALAPPVINCDDLQPLDPAVLAEHLTTSSPIPVVQLSCLADYVSDISADVTARSVHDDASDHESKVPPSLALQSSPPRHVLLTAASFHHQLDVFLSRTNSDKSLKDITVLPGDEVVLLDSPQGIKSKELLQQKHKSSTSETEVEAPRVSLVSKSVELDLISSSRDEINLNASFTSKIGDVKDVGVAVAHSHSGEDYEASYEDFEAFEDENEPSAAPAGVATAPVASTAKVPPAVLALDFTDLRPAPERPDTRLTVDPVPASASVATVSSKYAVGALVLANFRGSGKWLPGKIVRDRGAGVYDVDYDNGAVEWRVGEAMIQMKEEQPPEKPTEESATAATASRGEKKESEPVVTADAPAVVATAAASEDDEYDFDNFDAEEAASAAAGSVKMTAAAASTVAAPVAQSEKIEPPTRAEARTDASPRADFKSYVFESKEKEGPSSPSLSYKHSAPSALDSIDTAGSSGTLPHSPSFRADAKSSSPSTSGKSVSFRDNKGMKDAPHSPNAGTTAAESKGSPPRLDAKGYSFTDGSDAKADFKSTPEKAMESKLSQSVVEKQPSISAAAAAATITVNPSVTPDDVREASEPVAAIVPNENVKDPSADEYEDEFELETSTKTNSIKVPSTQSGSMKNTDEEYEGHVNGNEAATVAVAEAVAAASVAPIPAAASDAEYEFEFDLEDSVKVPEATATEDEVKSDVKEASEEPIVASPSAENKSSEKSVVAEPVSVVVPDADEFDFTLGESFNAPPAEAKKAADLVLSAASVIVGAVEAKAESKDEKAAAAVAVDDEFDFTLGESFNASPAEAKKAADLALSAASVIVGAVEAKAESKDEKAAAAAAVDDEFDFTLGESFNASPAEAKIVGTTAAAAVAAKDEKTTAPLVQSESDKILADADDLMDGAEQPPVNLVMIAPEKTTGATAAAASPSAAAVVNVVAAAPVSTPTKRVTIALENNRVRVKSKDFNDDFIDEAGGVSGGEEPPIRVGSGPPAVENAVAAGAGVEKQEKPQQQLVQEMMHRADSAAVPSTLVLEAQESGNISTITMSMFDSASYAHLSHSLSTHPGMPSVEVEAVPSAGAAGTSGVVSPPNETPIKVPNAIEPEAAAVVAAVVAAVEATTSKPENYDEEFDALFEKPTGGDEAVLPPLGGSSSSGSVSEDRRSSIHREDAVYLQTIEAYTNHESDGQVFDPPAVEREESQDFRTIFGSQVTSPLTAVSTPGGITATAAASGGGGAIAGAGGNGHVGIAVEKTGPLGLPLDTIRSEDKSSSLSNNEDSGRRATGDPTPTPSHHLSHASTNISTLTMSQLGSGSILTSELSSTQMTRDTPATLPPTHSVKVPKSPEAPKEQQQQQQQHVHVTYRPELTLHLENPRDLSSMSSKNATPTGALTFSMKQKGLDHTGITQLEYIKKDYDKSMDSVAMSQNSSISSAGQFFADIEDGFEVVGSPAKSPDDPVFPTADSRESSTGSKSRSSHGSRNSKGAVVGVVAVGAAAGVAAGVAAPSGEGETKEDEAVPGIPSAQE